MIKQLFTKDKKLLCEVKYSEEFFSNYTKHFHDKLNINIIEEGEIQIEFKDSRFEVQKPNQFSIFRPYEIHKTTENLPQSKAYHVLYFGNEFLEKYFPMHFDNNVIDDEELTKKLLKISIDIQNGKNDLEEELVDFFEELSKKHLKTHQIEPQNILIDDIKKYLIENIELTPTLEMISKDFCLSKEHIIRIFKKELGITPHAFITNYKVNLAKNQISNESTKSLTDIAYESGFYDQSHFSKNFKKVFAISPKEVLE